MPASPEDGCDHHLLRRRLKESFAPIYLTALSVIQGVALADLATVVLPGYQRFSVTQWVLTLFTFGMLIFIWNAYTIQTTLWDWIPDLRDATIPFVFGAVELFLNHMITTSLGGWLAALALLSGVGMLANWYGGWRAREEAENARLLGLVARGMYRFQTLYSVILTAALLGLGLLCWTAGLEAAGGLDTGQGVLSLLVTLLAGTGVGVYVYLNMRVWAQVVTYARTGRIPGPDRSGSRGGDDAATAR